ncbi:MAG TPA: YwiC-like family protein [Nocardioidaceae bacterium]|nr:YwiC-like family protein [Nocardioidaceae bacterium]
MAAPDTRNRSARTGSRRGPGWVPNQHGAWGMLASPFLVGVVAASPRWVHLPLLLLWFVGYFAFFAAGLWLKSGRRARYLPPVRAYGLATIPLAVVVLLLRPDLVVWAPLFAPLLLAGLWFAAHRQDRSLPSGLATILAACLMTMVAFDAGDGTDWARAWTLTAVLAGYFVGTLFYVKTMIRERDSRPHYWLSVGYHAALTVAAAWLSWWLAGLFALLALRAAVLPGRGLSPKQVGIGEIVANIAVVVVALRVV